METESKNGLSFEDGAAMPCGGLCANDQGPKVDFETLVRLCPAAGMVETHNSFDTVKETNGRGHALRRASPKRPKAQTAEHP